MIALLRCGQARRAACQGHTHTLAAHSPRPEVGSSRLAAEWGPLWWSPQATLGCKGKTVEQGLGWWWSVAGFFKECT